MPTAPIGGKAAWIGREIQQRSNDWTYEMTEEDLAELAAALQRFQSAHGASLREVSIRSFHLPTLGPKLKRIAAEIEDGQGFMLLRGMPTNEVPLQDIRIMYLGISVHIGLIVAQNGKNDLVGSVRNEGAVYGPKVRGYQSNIGLGYHNDAGAAVGLCCIKAAKSGGISKIVSAITLHDILMLHHPDVLHTLYEEPFYYSWKADRPSEAPAYYWSRAFSWLANQLRIRWIEVTMMETQHDLPDVPRLTAAQQKAFDTVHEIVNRPEMCLDMDFKPGDIQYLNNWTTFHGRTPFEDHDDLDERRHLLRVWLNRYEEPPMAADFTDRYDQLGDSGVHPHRRLFEVPVVDNSG